MAVTYNYFILIDHLSLTNAELMERACFSANNDHAKSMIVILSLDSIEKI